MIFYALTSVVLKPERVKQRFDNQQGPRRCLCSSQASFIAMIRLIIKAFLLENFGQKML